MIGLDGEYVFFDKAQMEFSSDGSQYLVKPKKARLARLSLVDAQHPDHIILDEYVEAAPDEVIVDYATEISGVHPIDLIPGKSRHRLSSRRSLLLRFQSLVDAGCVFVGHGLENDFRVLNINVDPRQVKDTVYLFYLPGNRFATWLHHRLIP